MIFVFVVAVVAVLGVVVWVVVWGVVSGVAFDAARGRCCSCVWGGRCIKHGVGPHCPRARRPVALAPTTRSLATILGPPPHRFDESSRFGARARGARRRQEKRNRMGNAVSFLLSFSFSSLPVLLLFFFPGLDRAGLSAGLPSCASLSIRSVCSCRFLVRFFLFCRARRLSSARPVSRRGCRLQAAPGALGALRPGCFLGLERTQERARSAMPSQARAGRTSPPRLGLPGLLGISFRFLGRAPSDPVGPGVRRSVCESRRSNFLNGIMQIEKQKQNQTRNMFNASAVFMLTEKLFSARILLSRFQVIPGDS